MLEHWYHHSFWVLWIILSSIWARIHFYWLIRQCKLCTIHKTITLNTFICNFHAFFLHPRFPFDWKTPFGYFSAFIIECGAAFSTVSCFIPMICFLAGGGWLIVSFIKDTIIDLSTFNANGLNKSDDKVKKHFYHIIKLHSELKELSWEI